MAKKTYRWANGTRLAGGIVGAQTVGECLARLQHANGGKLTPEIVLNFAKRKSSPLHGYFTWDDTEAAQKCRTVEAYSILRAVVIVEKDDEDDEPRAVRAFVNDAPIGNLEKGSYRAVGSVLSSSKMRAEMLKKAMWEAECWMKRYEKLAALAGVMKVFGRALTKVRKIGEKTRA